MKTPAGGDRSTQWVIQYRKSVSDDIPLEETLWTRHLLAYGGPAVKAALKELREETFGLDWRAIRIETVQRVEDW